MRGLAVLAALTAAALLSAPTAAAKPRDFVGIVAEDVFWESPSYREQSFAVQRQLGVQVVRQTFDWSRIETAPGQYDFSEYDSFVAHAARHGIRIVPVLFRPPAFRARGVHTDRKTYPPKTFAHMGHFGAAIAERYGRGGSLWNELPSGSAKRPITSYQVWNEPNFPVYWPGGPNAKQYVKLLKKTGKAIKSVDRRAKILTGGLPDSKSGGAVRLFKYIRQLYKAGGKRHFDVLSINTYAKNPRQLAKLLRKVRKLMNKRRDRKAKIWASEFGWATQGPDSRFTVGAKKQARHIGGSIKKMGKLRRKLKLAGFVYWNWKDAPPYRVGFDFWGLHAGLVQQDGAPKPALAAFAKAVKKL